MIPLALFFFHLRSVTVALLTSPTGLEFYSMGGDCDG
nr:MAG TPA: hypothetical protein [Caudoviricetes sp.]